MSRPAKTDLVTMDYAFGGQPFAGIPAHSGTADSTLDYAFGGQPFVFYDTSTAGAATRHTKPYRFNLGSSRGRSYRYRG